MIDSTREPLEIVLQLLERRVPRLGSESIPLTGAVGRVLAEPVCSAVDVPSFAKSAMDGFALFGRRQGAFEIVGESFPGRPFTASPAPGAAIRIATGAPVPAEAAAIVPIEFTTELDGQVHVDVEVPEGKHIIRVGEDVRNGATVLDAGRVLRPQDIGLLASISVGTVEVIRRPRVAVLATGNELIPAGQSPVGSQTVDSNTPMLAALIERDGGILSATQAIRDELDALREAIQTADADVILVTGGSSVGREDHAPRAVAELGELAVRGVAMKPGGPTGVGLLMDPFRVVFLLPGHPVACLCAYDLLACRAIRRLGGRGPTLPYRTLQARLASEVRSAPHRVDAIRVKLDEDGTAHPLAAGASQLFSSVAADGFVLIPHERMTLPAGESIEVFLYDA